MKNFNPDFSHRLSCTRPVEKYLDVVDLADDMANDAVGVIESVAGLFAKKGDYEVDDDSVFYALKSAAKSVRDIQSLLNAYLHTQREAHGVPELSGGDNA
jgi:hypothetical protein